MTQCPLGTCGHPWHGDVVCDWCTCGDEVTRFYTTEDFLAYIESPDAASLS